MNPLYLAQAGLDAQWYQISPQLTQNLEAMESNKTLLYFKLDSPREGRAFSRTDSEWGVYELEWI